MAEKKMFTDAEMTEAADLMHQVSNLYVSTKHRRITAPEKSILPWKFTF